MLAVLLESIWLILPASVANTMPVIAAHLSWLPSLNRPLDGGKTWRGNRLLGNNKTIRGVVIGVIFGSITGYFQYLLYAFSWVQDISLISYEAPLTALLFGALLGLGALAGDAIESFVKRLRKFPPGAPWPPWDQIDSAIGALLVSVPIVPLTIAHDITIIVIVGIGSYVVSIIGVAWGIKKSL